MDILNYLSTQNSIKEVITSRKMSIKGSNDNATISLLACDFITNNDNIFVVLPNLFSAQKYYDELINILPEEDVLFYPADELLTSELLVSSGDFKFERINTIATLLEGNKKVIVTHTNGIIKYQFDKIRWLESIITFKTGDIVSPDELIKKLVFLGYEKTYTVLKTGQISKRGSIVDIFPLNYENPVRLDFFDNEIETIKTFNIESQRSLDLINQIKILPVRELLFNDEEKKTALTKLAIFKDENKLSTLELEKIDNDINKIKENMDLELMSRYISFFTKPITIFDYVENKKLYVIDLPKIEELYNHLQLDLGEYCDSIGGYSIFKLEYFSNLNEIKDKYSQITIEGLRTIESNYDLLSSEVEPFKSDEKKIAQYLYNYYKTKKIIITIQNESRYKTLEDTLLDKGIPYTKLRNNEMIKYGQIHLLYGTYYPSFELIKDNLVIINERTIFEISRSSRKIKYKSTYQNTTKVTSFEDLEALDYVVHYDHGIGQYLGIKTMELDGIVRDYIHIKYANEGACYIPVEQINLIMRYEATEGSNVRLSNLSTGEWARAKARAKNRIKDISEQLIKLYALREASEGYRCEPDTMEQLQFENDFPYELTLDQEKAVIEIKRDMESGKPMDRLVCGDVGYGKTEVALRAAFKAILNGKQVAMLAPTTVLSRQHFYTFKNRMEKYGAKVELLNRFVKMKKQEEIIKKIKTGEVDVVIGTHRILSNEIVFKDLGLLIIDEEQRFGVSHKERIKEMKVNVDAITLSATPIPRTLQMSIVGIKDLSMIETPPKNRYPVQTYVLKRNDAIIRESIEREMARGGQVFYLYNFTEDIEDVKVHLNKLVPEARICIGHGKLSKNQLEDVICNFIDKEYDVLLCTTIIETGIDMPDTNTLIIHDADRLGLSQLYQIRGRVGRSNKIAYAYLMYDEGKILTETAEMRLQTIKEFNALGSGFKIAMRDLSIRGAGDILGEDQSGFIDSIGLETYLKILEEEIESLKGPKYKEKEFEQDITMKKAITNRSIPTSYIDNEGMKIQIHKKIDKIKKMEDITDLKKELIDRFGRFDESLESYMYEKLFKQLSKEIGIYKMQYIHNTILVLWIKEEYSIKLDGNKLFNKANELSPHIGLNYKNNQIQILIDTKFYPNNEHLKLLATYLDIILK